MKKEYKTGQILISKYDMEAETELSGEKIIIPKGNKIIIGADNFAHHISTGLIQPLGDNAVVKGYDAEGISMWLYIYLCRYCEINDMLEDCDDTKEHFMEVIKSGLNEIGF